MAPASRWAAGQLDKAKADNKELTDQAEKLKKQYDAEKAAKTPGGGQAGERIGGCPDENSRHSKRSRPNWKRLNARPWPP